MKWRIFGSLQKEKRCYESNGAFSFSLILVLFLALKFRALFFQKQNDKECEEEREAV
jgi:hypothetical protein